MIVKFNLELLFVSWSWCCSQLFRRRNALSSTLFISLLGH